MTVEEYRSILHEDMILAANVNLSNVEDEFLRYVTDILSAGDEFDDFIECYYEGISRRKANMRIDGYAMDEADGSCCVFISDYRGPNGDDAIRTDDINNLFRKLRFFVEEAIKYELYQELEESTQTYEFAQMLYFDVNKITKFRFYLLTDAYNRQRKKNLKASELAGKTVELNVWDISRIFDIVNSTTQKENTEIFLSEFGTDGIPCVKAVDYRDILSDIEVTPSYGNESETGNKIKPENIISYSSYLAVVPGQILNDLYLEYGSRLLEGNVRSFLSVRGKVNKSIQNTIKNYPEMFFAYNNGIAATATEIDTEMTRDGLKITRIKDLQIVNGGQTTASIANTLLTARKDEKIDISRLFVPMKISVLEHSISERIIPRISEYSNSQNKVDASDFFSNHPFHIRIEELSRKTPAPAVHGNQFQQYWYYERTRGQYNQGKMKYKPKSSQMKEYETRYPESQVIKMVDLAKYMLIYSGVPYIVSKGKQEIVKTFSASIKKQWERSDSGFSSYYYKRVVSLAIIFKATDNIIKSSEWYKLKHSYKANVVAYTLSIIFEYIRNNLKEFRFDFMRIWNTQEIYPEMEHQIKILCTEVYEFITRDDRPVENVTQWCKQEKCWDLAKKQDWTMDIEFLKTLVPKEILVNEESGARDTQKNDNEMDVLQFIMRSGTDYWKNMLKWSVQRRLLTDMEESILKMVINMNNTGRIPTVRQANALMRARDRMISEGMPLQF